jgi:hypothetical protein
LPQPTFDDIRRFCEIDSWSKQESAKGKTGDDDATSSDSEMEASLARSLAQQRPARRLTSLAPDLESATWTGESEAQFWAALRTSVPVQRKAEAPKGTPDGLIRRLIHQVGLTEDAALSLSPEEAAARWERFITSLRE